MVDKIFEILKQIPNIWDTLDGVSDNCCSDENGEKFIKFDKLKEYLSLEMTKGMNSACSCDMLFLETAQNHIVFVEFKDLSNVADFRAWIGAECRKENMLLKISDSIFLLSFFLNKQHNINFDDYFKIKQSFILAYKVDSSVKKIQAHLNFTSRYNFILQNNLSMSSDKFYNKWLS
ncbi:MAG: hypothetical protein ACLFOC_10165 [Campylobacterales bacterium]